MSAHRNAVGLAVLSCILVACGGGGDVSGGTPMPGPATVTGTSVTWAADNRTKTTTTSFSDGTTRQEVVDVAPVQSGGNLTTSGSANSTSQLVNTFGNGVVETLQDGSATKPFQQTLLAGRGNADPNAVVVTPTQTLNLSWGTKAAPYILPSTNNVQFTATSTEAYLEIAGIYGSASQILPLAVNHTAPLNVSTAGLQNSWITADVKAAWAQGWTGLGIKIGVIDDFTANSVSDLKLIQIPGVGCRVESEATLCANEAIVALSMTHGEQVALIAGGSLSSLSGLYGEAGNYVVNNPVDFGQYLMLSDLTVSLSAPFYGVAKDAQVFRNDFLTYQSATNGLFSELQRWGSGLDASSALYRELKVVNLSLGGTSQNPVANVATYATQLGYANASNVPDAVFVKAAGNSGCVISLTNCDPNNAVLYNSPNYKDKTLIVGALDRADGAIAGYSNTAGVYSDRFVVADGRGIEMESGVPEEGTSFAAPRVSGYVAIVRQKFPSLTAEKTASIILDTARWNVSWGDKNQANVAIYGQGEANLGRALAPVGSLR